MYFVSGDRGFFSFLFFIKNNPSNITYVAIGIDNTVYQGIVNNSVKVSFYPIFLTGKKLKLIECCGLDYWMEYFKQKEKNKVNKLKLTYF